MKRKALALTLISAMLFLAVAGTHLVSVVTANGYIPEPTTQMTIGNPVNRTYYVNTITLDFHVVTSYWDLNFFYSLDGQDMKKVENLSTFSKVDLNAGKNPSVYMTTLKGTCVLGNLSEGWHNATVYQFSYANGDPQNEEIVYSADVKFLIAIPPEPFPTTLVPASVASVAVVSVGLVVYFRKVRKGRI